MACCSVHKSIRNSSSGRVAWFPREDDPVEQGRRRRRATLEDSIRGGFPLVVPTVDRLFAAYRAAVSREAISAITPSVHLASPTVTATPPPGQARPRKQADAGRLRRTSLSRRTGGSGTGRARVLGDLEVPVRHGVAEGRPPGRGHSARASSTPGICRRRRLGVAEPETVGRVAEAAQVAPRSRRTARRPAFLPPRRGATDRGPRRGRRVRPAGCCRPARCPRRC